VSCYITKRKREQNEPPHRRNYNNNNKKKQNQETAAAAALDSDAEVIDSTSVAIVHQTLKYIKGTQFLIINNCVIIKRAENTVNSL
jgi:hypothetical protein